MQAEVQLGPAKFSKGTQEVNGFFSYFATESKLRNNTAIMQALLIAAQL